MFHRLAVASFVALLVAGAAAEAVAQNGNPAYYGTTPGLSARAYSGEYQATQPNIVPTFSLPVYGGNGYRTYYRGGYYGGYGGFYPYPVYQQPFIVYPPRVYYNYGVF